MVWMEGVRFRMKTVGEAALTRSEVRGFKYKVPIRFSVVGLSVDEFGGRGRFLLRANQANHEGSKFMTVHLYFEI